MPTVNDLNFAPIDFGETFDYLNGDFSTNNQYWKVYITKLKIFCEKIIPFVDFYKKQHSSYNHTLHKILNEMFLILPNVPKEKRGIITSLITGFIGLAYKCISNYLHNRWQKAMHQAFVAMEKKVDLQHNKIVHLGNSMVMYGIYNSETLEKLITTLHIMHNTTTWNKKLFTRKLTEWHYWYLSKIVLAIIP